MSFNDILKSIAEAAAQTSPLEYAAVVSALAYVILAALENILCWLFGILSSIIYTYICFAAHLYLETGLQVFYVAMGVYGWVEWSKGKENSDPLHIIEWHISKHIPLLILGAVAGLGLGYLFARYTSASQPYFDAMITSFSLIATWMVTKKLLENWIYWIIIDAASIILYSRRGLYLSGALYLLYTILAVAGYLAWKRDMERSRA